LANLQHLRRNVHGNVSAIMASSVGAKSFTMRHMIGRGPTCANAHRVRSVAARFACILLALSLTQFTPRLALAKELWETLEATGHVNDYAALLSVEDRRRLETQLDELQKATTHEVSIVTLKSLEGGEIDDFTNRLFVRWGIGKQRADNGAMLLVAIQERKARIEVGNGLEEILPDALAGRILDQELFPAFREQRYTDGLSRATTRLVDIVERAEPASLVDRHGILSPNVSSKQTLVVLPFFAIFVAVGGFLLGAGFGSKTGPLVMAGVMFAGMPGIMGLITCGFWSILVHWPIAAYCAYRGFSSARRNPQSYRGGVGRRGYNTSPGGWTWGSSSGGGSSWGGGFSSGGGFGGFGGGSSSGGGASGGW